MEGHKVAWSTNVPYEDLVKQCPFLSQRASLPMEKKLGDNSNTPEIQISKSKKKRLKKRLKAISLSNKNISSENLKSSLEAELSEMSSESKGALPTDENTGKEIEKLKRVSDEIDGEISVTHPKVCGKHIAEKEVKKKSKHTKEINKDDQNLEVKELKSSAIKPLAKVDPSKRDSNNLEFTVPYENVSGTKKNEIIIDSVQIEHSHVIAQNTTDVRSREDVLAEREAKKKVKHLSKQKKIDKSQQNSSEELPLEAENKLSTVSSNVHGIIPPLAERNKLGEEKSREEVIAEREAKKRAKLLAKQKKIDRSQEAPEKLIVEINKVEVTGSIVDSKSEYKKHDGKSDTVKNDNKVKESTVLVEKSKSQLRAERRALQEAQRAAKETEKKKKEVLVENKENQVITTRVLEKPVLVKEGSREPKTTSKGKIVSHQRIKLFSHLHLGQRPSLTQLIPNIHPSVVELGLKYSSRIINGSNARCVALLNCLKEVINDYSTPAEKEFSRGLESKLGELTNYLNQYRPFAVSMTNALRHIKSHLTQLPNNVSDDEAKRKLLDVIDTFIKEQIDVAGEAICESVKNKITNGDSILIYSCSSLLYRILTETYRSGRKFSVIVVDGGPWFEGREMLRRLVEAGLKCSYVHISALSFIVRQATKVLTGAHALLANGCVMSRAGSALVALAAHAHSVPVLVCCETYKFCERVQTDSFVYNELGSTDDLTKEDKRLSDWQSLTFLTPLSILYDITPPDLVTAVVTEIAILPCTSVPVILRVKPSDVVS